MCTQAAKEVEDFPIFWLRGLPPQIWYDNILAKYPVPQESWEHCCWGCLLESESEPFVLPVGSFVAVDASGGAFTADPRLRRISFGMVVVAADMEIIGGIGGQVPGPQTVNRCELFATMVALERTSGDITIVSDSAYVYRPFAEDFGDNTTTPHFHFDLWGRLGS